MNKALSAVGAVAGVSASITKEDLIFILGVVVTVINLVIAYLDRRNANAKR